MFCDEPILNVYIGREDSTDPKGSSFLDVVELVYHVTPLHRIVLETEHWAITIDSNGASKEPRNALAEQTGEWLDDTIHTSAFNDTPWIEYENTLFVGERLLEVQNDDAGYLLIFDDFHLRVIPYALGSFDVECLREPDNACRKTKGCNRLLKRVCDCGSNPEIMLDCVSDYFVMCEKCKKHTWASPCVYTAITDWNANELADAQDV